MQTHLSHRTFSLRRVVAMATSRQSTRECSRTRGWTCPGPTRISATSTCLVLMVWSIEFTPAMRFDRTTPRPERKQPKCRGGWWDGSERFALGRTAASSWPAA